MVKLGQRLTLCCVIKLVHVSQTGGAAWLVSRAGTLESISGQGASSTVIYLTEKLSWASVDSGDSTRSCELQT